MPRPRAPWHMGFGAWWTQSSQLARRCLPLPRPCPPWRNRRAMARRDPLCSGPANFAGSDLVERRSSDRAAQDRPGWSIRRKSGTWTEMAPRSARSLPRRLRGSAPAVPAKTSCSSPPPSENTRRGWRPGEGQGLCHFMAPSALVSWVGVGFGSRQTTCSQRKCHEVDCPSTT